MVEMPVTSAIFRAILLLFALPLITRETVPSHNPSSLATSRWVLFALFKKYFIFPADIFFTIKLMQFF